jgi:signal transduction histidine kinase
VPADLRQTLSLRDAVPVLVIAALLEAGALSSPATRPFDHVVVCRRAPLVALAAATACMLLYSVRADPGPSATFPVLVALFAAVATGHRVAAVTAAVAFLGGGLATDLADALAAGSGQAPQPLVEATVLLLGWFMAAGVAGIAARNWRAYLLQVEQRAADAERTREEAALRRAGEERLRIARELHDSLTHSISIIKVQAGVAVHLARKRGEEVPQALLAIQEASGEAMRELRATLEVLRDAADDPPGSGLDRLDDLVKRARDAGLPTTVTIDGDRRALPTEVDRAAYRIVQESLTNVSRHAGPASASVWVRYGDDNLLVQVDDDGHASPEDQPVPGVGLLGMRERVTALSGHLEAAPRPGGGFTGRAARPPTPPPPPPPPPGPPLTATAHSAPTRERPTPDHPTSDRRATAHKEEGPSAPAPSLEETA